MALHSCSRITGVSLQVRVRLHAAGMYTPRRAKPARLPLCVRLVNGRYEVLRSGPLLLCFAFLFIPTTTDGKLDVWLFSCAFHTSYAGMRG